MQRAEPLSESKKKELTRRLLDGTGDFNNDGTPDILQHQINHNDGSMTLRALQMNPNAVQVQSAPTLGTIGANFQVDGTGDFNGDGTSDILVHQDLGTTRASL